MKAILCLALGLTLLCARQVSAQTDYTIGEQDWSRHVPIERVRQQGKKGRVQQ